MFRVGANTSVWSGNRKYTYILFGHISQNISLINEFTEFPSRHKQRCPHSGKSFERISQTFDEKTQVSVMFYPLQIEMSGIFRPDFQSLYLQTQEID